MKRRNFLTLLMILALMITGLVGCKKADTEEGTASPADYVEGQNEETEKVTVPYEGASSDSDSDTQTPQQQSPANQPSTQKPSTQTPSTQKPSAQTPSTQKPSADNNDNPSEDADEKVNYLEGNKLKIVSYNIRCANDEGGRSIAERAPRLKTVLDQYQPDIIGFQEVVPEWMNYLTKDYSANYNYKLEYRSETSREGTPIFWRKDKFELVDSGYFWLSETPNISGSMSWGATFPRICIWVKLKIKATGKEFLFYNTHFDFNETAHQNSAKLIIQDARSRGGFTKLAVFCTADFNMKPWSPGYVAMQTAFEDINDQLDQDTSYTSHGYKDSGSIIDYCFYSRDLVTPLHYNVMKEMPDGNYVSDHFGIYNEVAIL